MSRKPSAEIDQKDLATKDGDDNKPIKAKMAAVLRKRNRIARFKGATIIEVEGVWVDMTSDRFAEACYKAFGDGVNKSRVTDLEHLFRSTAPDMSDKAQYIAFGQGVWDMKALNWTQAITAEDCVYRVPYDSQPNMKKGRIPFVMDLAKGDEGVYDDIMQSVAPLIMDKKPTGVIWYLGNGANGKSTLVHLLYMMFGPYFTELTVKQLEDERDTPQLNGKLGNVCKESSEGFVEDTRTYKSIGTHEGFSVHKFHSQDMVEIEGNIHHIFSANNIPTFGDKSYGARRRTLVIPFNNRFKPDESFEEKTFTPQFLEHFISEMVKYALILKERNYEYKFSETTQEMKEKYDTESNTAQTYADELIQENIYAFRSFTLLYVDYQNWCSERGYKPSTLGVLRRGIEDHNFQRRSSREENGKISKVYLRGNYQLKDMSHLQTTHLGLYQLKATAEEGDIPEEQQQKLLAGW